jgi:peptidoglycan/xylan/chitin deacetylase (PgdA/CDA1 family)
MKSYASCLRDDTFVIFLLHGVIPRQKHAIRNYIRKHLPMSDFSAFLKEITQAGTAVSMNQIVAAHQEGERLPKRAFAVTFDDGFENNASVAAPVLDDLKIPATFYVTTGFVGSETRSWTDEIEAALEQTGPLRLQGLAGEIDGRYDTVEEKISLMDRIRTHVKGSDGIDPYVFASKVVEQTGAPGDAFDRDLDAKLGWDQVRQLARHPLFAVGGHSHSHRNLAFLPDDELENEITTSLRLLTDATGSNINHYSYPEGMAHSYSDKVISLLKRHGIVCAPTAEEGNNHVSDSLFHLKRVFVI